MAKYELIESDRPGLFRVRALMNFSDVAVGDVGGYVEGEHNLSQNGTAWVRGHAVVYDQAVVCDHAVVCDQAVVRGHAEVCGHAVVRGHAEVCGHAKVYDQAGVCDQAGVYDQAVVCDQAVVRGHAGVYDHVVVCGHAEVAKTTDLLVIGPIGTRSTYMTICIPAGTVTTGCFHGSVDEFETAVAANPNGRGDYIAIIPAIRVIIANRTREVA